MGDTSGLVTLSKGAVVASNGDAYDFKIASHDAGTYGLYLGDTLVEASASEINYLHDITLGTSTDGKVVTTDTSGLVTLSKGAVVASNGDAYDFKIASHDAGTYGLYLGDTLVEASASEINYLHDITLGTSTDGKVVTQSDTGDLKINGFLKMQNKLALSSTAITGQSNNAQDIDPSGSASTVHYTIDG